jgi:tetratricopeptide (TPR) repeat protein
VGGFIVWQRAQLRAERREALQLADKGEFTRAESLLLRLAQRDPNDAAVAEKLALGYFNANRFAEAEPFYAQWCAATPRDPKPYLERIEMWKKWSRLENVVDDSRHVLDLQPDNQKLHQELPRWLLIMGRLDEAEQECQRFLRHWPDEPWVLLILAMVNQRKDHPREAAVIVDKLVREFADFAEAFVLRGTLYREANQPAEAIPWLRRAVAIPGAHRREALYELSRVLSQTGQTQEAEQAMKEARLLQEQSFLSELAKDLGPGPISVSARVRLAEELINAGRADEGVLMLERLLDQNPNYAAAHRVLADYYEKQGQPERAAQHRRLQGSTP